MLLRFFISLVFEGTLGIAWGVPYGGIPGLTCGQFYRPTTRTPARAERTSWTV